MGKDQSHGKQGGEDHSSLVLSFLVSAFRGELKHSPNSQERNHKVALVQVPLMQLGTALTSLVMALSLGTTGLASRRLAGDVESLCACE
jgi:hypothetical protein